jgi:uncharacterized membrane protein
MIVFVIMVILVVLVIISIPAQQFQSVASQRKKTEHPEERKKSKADIDIPKEFSAGDPIQ